MRLSALQQQRFGALPPKLFTPLSNEEKEQYQNGDYWQNPDGEYTQDELEQLLKMPGGALRLFADNGLRGSIKKLGLRGFLGEMKLKRVFKETAKRMLGDPNQNYTPVAINGVWMHGHDRDHLMVSQLPTIQMGKYEGVNGIDGLSGRLVPHFHPDEPGFKPKYPGMLDEYRVAIHQHVTSPSPVSLARLLFYQGKLIKLVPSPRKAVKAHREAFEKHQSTDNNLSIVA